MNRCLSMSVNHSWRTRMRALLRTITRMAVISATPRHPALAPAQAAGVYARAGNSRMVSRCPRCGGPDRKGQAAPWPGLASRGTRGCRRPNPPGSAPCGAGGGETAQCQLGHLDLVSCGVRARRCRAAAGWPAAPPRLAAVISPGVQRSTGRKSSSRLARPSPLERRHQRRVDVHHGQLADARRGIHGQRPGPFPDCGPWCPNRLRRPRRVRGKARATRRGTRESEATAPAVPQHRDTARKLPPSAIATIRSADRLPRVVYRPRHPPLGQRQRASRIPGPLPTAPASAARRLPGR